MTGQGGQGTLTSGGATARAANGATGGVTGGAGSTPGQTLGGTGGGTWQLLQGRKYDPDAVYSSSTDGRGHYEQIRVKVTPTLEHCIGLVVADDQRYRSREDFIRNAIFHALYRAMSTLPNLSPEVSRYLQMEQRRIQGENELRMRKGHFDTIEVMRDLIDANVEDEDWNKIAEIAEEMYDASQDESLPPGIREHYEDVSDDAREALVKGMKGGKRRRRHILDG